MKSNKSILYSVVVVLCFIFSFSQGSFAYMAGPQAPFMPSADGHIVRQRDYRPQDNFSKEKQKGKYKEGELLVKFKPSASDSRRKQIHAKHGSQVLKEFKSIRVHHIKLKAGLSVEEAITSYRADPDVEYAEPNNVVSALNTPNDPMFSALWGLHNTGQTGGTSGADIKAPEAWDITMGSNDVVVAVIDTGIDYYHQDLAANMWINPGEISGNGIDDDGNGYVDDVYGINTFSHDSDPMDDNGHGTLVAGIIGASGNNGVGVVGVNWHVKILSCKFLDATGLGDSAGAIECLQYIKTMKDKGIKIVATNNSWGCSGGCYSQALYDAINSQQDILFIAAAGNDAADNDTYGFFPANYNLPNVISVAATDDNDHRAVSFSNYGRRSVHVGAPGLYILSTLPAQNQWNISGGYGQLSGTSLAAPHVAGLAALIKSQNTGMDWRGIKNLILSGGDTVTSLDGITITGKRLNAYGSLTCSDKPVISVLSLPSTVSIGVPVTLSALSINCASPMGTVTVTTGAGDSITLHDDGIAPDLAAGDGIFTGAWTPTRVSERLDFTFSSPFGSKTETVFTPPISMDFEILNCTLGETYSHFLKAHGGLPPYTWSITSGSLPPGLTLNASTGEISGTASSAGVFTFTVKVIETFTNAVSKTFSIRVIEDSVPEQWRAIHITGATTGISGGMGIAVDASNNVYVSGPSFLDGYPYDHIVTMKYDSSDNVLWEKPYIGGDDDWVSDITVDGNGNVYLVGSADALIPGWGWQAHWSVVKYDPSGNIIWTKTDYDGDACAYGVAVDKNGNIFVSGASHCGYSGDYRIVKYDPSGNIIWTETYGDASHNEVPSGGIAIDGNGNIVVSGFACDNYSNCSHLIVKYDQSGNVVWTNRTDAAATTISGHGIAADTSGNIYVIRRSLSEPDMHILIMKLDPSGSPLWTVPYYGYLGNSLTVDESDNVYVTGAGYIFDEVTQRYSQMYLTVKYDPLGTVIWTKTSDGGGGYSYGIAVDGKGSVYVTGLSVPNFNWLTIKYNDPGNKTCDFTPTSCDDGNACTTDTCDPATGRCVYTPVVNGTICDDNKPCTINDVCTNGICAGTPKPIDDGNPCTTDACDPVTGTVSHTPVVNGTICDDNKPCTINDVCTNGTCAGTPKPIDDLNPCTTDACDPVTGNVTHTPVTNGTPCDDGNYCTVSDTCSNGVCKGKAGNSGKSCDDGNACTTNDKCSSGVCKGTAKNCSDNNACTTDTCDPSTGACLRAPVVCNDNNPCTIDTCVPATGCKYTAVANGTACDDGNLCTVNDSCQSGKCTGTAKDCNDHNLCTADSCDATTGQCVHTFNKPKSVTVLGSVVPRESSTTNKQIQTQFSVINDGCVVASGLDYVSVSIGSVIDVNCKVGTGPNPTTIKLDGVSYTPIPDHSTISCPDAITAHTIYLDNLKASGGKDVDNILLKGNIAD